LQVDDFLLEDTDLDVLTRNITNLSISTKFIGSDALDAPTASLLSDLRNCSSDLILGKLREALISLRKEDQEAQDILVASAKVGILSHHGETYLPSLRTLLTLPSYPSCIVTWYALYLLFILEDLSEFYAFTSLHPVDHAYKDIARAIVNGNYIAYTNLLREGSRFDKALIVDSPGDIRMKNRIIEVVGKCYYRVDTAWFNRLSNTNQWPREGNMYIIRRQKVS
jgi:hypothetical protein